VTGQALHVFYTVLGLEDALSSELSLKGFRVEGKLPSRVLARGRGPWPRTASRVAALAGTSRAQPSTRGIRLALRGAMPRRPPCRVEGRVHGGCYPGRMLERVAAREAERRGCGEGLLLVDYFCREGLLLVGVEEARLWRGRRAYYGGWHPATLNPLIAAALPFIAGVTAGTLLDPLCGAATIPVESWMSAGVEGLCSDYREEYVARARGLVKRLRAPVSVFAADVFDHPSRRVDLVATDPPRRSVAVHVKLAAAAARLGRRAAIVTPYPRLVSEAVGGEVAVRTFQGGVRVYVVVGRGDATG